MLLLSKLMLVVSISVYFMYLIILVMFSFSVSFVWALWFQGLAVGADSLFLCWVAFRSPPTEKGAAAVVAAVRDTVCQPDWWLYWRSPSGPPTQGRRDKARWMDNEHSQGQGKGCVKCSSVLDHLNSFLCHPFQSGHLLGRSSLILLGSSWYWSIFAFFKKRNKRVLYKGMFKIAVQKCTNHKP